MGPYMAGSGNTILGQLWQQFQGGNNPAAAQSPGQPPAGGAAVQPPPQNYGQQGMYNTLAQDLANQQQGQYSFGGNRFSYQPAQQPGFRQQWPGFFRPPTPPQQQYGWGGPQYLPGGSPFGGTSFGGSPFGGFGGYSNPYRGYGGFGGYGGRFGGGFGRFY